MSGPVVELPTSTQLHLETQYPDGTVTVAYPEDEIIVLEISGNWGTIAVTPDPEEAREVGGALLQLAERIETNRDDDPSEELTNGSDP